MAKEQFEGDPIESVLKALGTDTTTGLSSQTVQERQQRFGFNEIPEAKQSSLLLFLRKFWGLTSWMLEATVVLSVALHHYLSASLIAALLLLNAILSFFQQKRSSEVVEALKKKLAIKTRTLRDGAWSLVPARELTVGEVVRLRAGDFVPADAKIFAGTASVDQSALTGESHLAQKAPGDLLFSGSVVKSGECNAVVGFVGRDTYFGKTTELVSFAKPRLNIEEIISKVVRFLMIIVIGSLALTAVVSYYRGDNLLDLLPVILILLVSAVPVALPAMFTVSMAIGSQELSKKGILVTRLNASEDVASMTTLCADKTGTITVNQLSLAETWTSPGFTAAELYRWGALASLEANKDPIDLAFIHKAAEQKIELGAFRQTEFVPFDPSTRKTEATIEFGERRVRVIKGAYPVVRTLCGLPESTHLASMSVINGWAEKGFRAIAVALVDGAAPRFVGIAALYDPPRPTSRGFIQELRELGVSIKMLTGDARPIAREVAREVGVGSNIATPEAVRAAIESKDPKAYEIVRNVDGFAEVLPEDKFLIVKTLQQQGEIVGMTGDGVNDAGALKQAEVGIAVSNATDIAKKAASVVLTDEGLGNIVNLIKMGRIIHHRVLNWILNKIVKTFQTVVFVCVAYLLTGQYMVTALEMALLLFILDFVTIAFSTDHVKWSKQPEVFEIGGLVWIGIILGVLAVVESLGILYLGTRFFHITAHPGALHSFGFALLFFSNVCTVFLIRERGHLWESAPSKPLLWAMGADSVVVFVMLAFGWIVTPLPVALLGLLVGCLVVSTVFNDYVKVAVYSLQRVAPSERSREFERLLRRLSPLRVWWGFKKKP
ncbi:MAG TPA: plasma-membrane proton-efflux P-type ATPase [Opitutaceae bacterium]|nr:plasma-membrane proton-efflux P-type ATPase [Opitutaceae bacterium]